MGYSVPRHPFLRSDGLSLSYPLCSCHGHGHDPAQSENGPGLNIERCSISISSSNQVACEDHSEYGPTKGGDGEYMKLLR